MNPSYLMNTATALFFVCYIPEFYANYVNKNANTYNVIEKGIMVMATGFGFGYAISIHNINLIVNYGPLFVLDVIGLIIKIYYAHRNRNRDVRVLSNAAENPMHLIEDPEEQ
jgi:hypothetical protein